MLASVQRITNLTCIEGADSIETAHLLGWQVVVKKGEFRVGDLVAYIQIDTVVPECEQFEFLRPRSFRVRTIKLRKQISQGLIIPLPKGKWKEGDDLTETLNIQKFTKEVELKEPRPSVPKVWYKKWIYLFRYKVLYKCFPRLEKKSKLPFPSNLVCKTDEERIQNIHKVLVAMNGVEFSATEKLNGSSITLIYDKTKKNPYRVCSRNFEFLNDKNEWSKVFAETEFQKHIDALVKEYGDQIILQGEYIGKPQGNYYRLAKNEIRIFNIFIKGKKATPYDTLDICNRLDIPHCPEVWRGRLNFSMEEILKFAEGKSLLNKDIEREGLVFRSLNGNTSFKVVSNKYLIKNEE